MVYANTVFCAILKILSEFGGRVGIRSDYSLLDRVSSGPLCDSWVAMNNVTRRRVFLKRHERRNSSFSEETRSQLRQSFEAQQALSGLIINKTRRIVEVDGQILLEHPYLDPSCWEPLSAKAIFKEGDSSLSFICMAVDYLHLMGYVHLDISSSNILVSKGEGQRSIRLTDTEFLRPVGSSTDNKVLGTPGHIAPEVMRNEHVSIETDNYALGCTLSGLADEFFNDNLEESNKPKSLAALQFCKKLTQEHRVDRPKFLLEELFATGYLDKEEFNYYSTKLLRRLLLSNFKKLPLRDRSNSDAISKVVHEYVGVLGLHNDLIEQLAIAYGQRHPQIGFILSELFQSQCFLRSGRFWISKLSDEQLNYFYNRLESSLFVSGRKLEPTQDESPISLVDLSAIISEMARTGSIERAFFKGLDIANNLILELHTTRTKDAIKLVLQVARLAYKLNRLTQADQFYRWVADLLGVDNTMVASDYVDWVSVQIKLGKREVAEQLILRGKKLVNFSNNRGFRLHLDRLECWLTYQPNNANSVMHALSRIEGEAKQVQATDVLALALYSKGVVEWRQGRFIESCKWLEEALLVCETNVIRDAALPINATLSLIHSECGNYKKAADSCSKAAAICREIHSYSQYYAICSNGMLAQIRLGNLGEAERWLHEYLTFSDKTFDLPAYLQTKALFQSLSGEVELSIETCQDALKLKQPGGTSRVLGKVHDTLATNFLFLGKLEECQASCLSALEIFDKIGDKAAISEIELISAAAKVCYCEGNGQAQIVADMKANASLASAIISAQTALISYLMGLEAIEDHLKAVSQRVKACAQWKEVPLFHTIVVVADSIETKQEVNHTLSTFKASVLKLIKSRQLFVALLLGMKIAQSYGARGQTKHQYKYFEQSLRLARELNNQTMILRIEEIMSNTKPSDSLSKEKEATLLSISNILKEGIAFDQSAHHLLEFAVSQTGAERGVLLLTQSSPDSLVPVASVNCDDASVHEVTDFSRSIAIAAAKGKTPTIIEDALLDDRTKGLKSILLHNVRSIVACPLMEAQECVGVLYLDHHTLSSLFSTEDLQYISAIANFITVALQKSREHRSLLRSTEALTEDLKKSGLSSAFFTQDRQVMDMLDKIPTIALSDKPVLLLGESGTGKEILSKMIHDLSKRAKQPLIKLNCAAISSTLLESELFGIAKGVATGVSEREGKFEAADGGTLYLDEIGDMSLEMQAKVLRVLEYQQFERVGSNKPRSVNVRLIYATNRDLLSAVKDGKFKHDLYHRINKIQIVIPPLRERPSDIPLLVHHFAQLFAEGGKPVQFTSNAETSLIAYSWPGNVRELKNLVERYSVVYSGQTITPDLLPPEILDSVPKSGESSLLKESREAESIRSALTRYKWNKSRAAKHLGIPLSTLRRKVEKYRISRPL